MGFEHTTFWARAQIPNPLTYTLPHNVFLVIES